MRALVTGATGFVGRHLVEVLLERGDQVTALVRTPAKAVGLAARGVRLVAGDLTGDAALREAAEGQDTVYHVAGLVAARNEAEFHAVNARGTARVVAAMAAVAPLARLVFVSSMAAGGPTERGRPRTGDEPAAPVTAYGRSKLAGEAVVRASGLSWTVIRPPAVYGPADTEMLRVFRAARLGVVPVFGDGGQELSLVYAPDLGRALVAAALAPAAAGGTYYAVHPEVQSSASVVITIGEALGRRPRLVRLPRPLATTALWLTGTTARLAGRATLLTSDKANEFYAPAWTADARPLAEAAGWTASHGLREGARLTAEWYRSEGWL